MLSQIKVQVDTTKTLLSSQSVTKKTEKFLSQTKYVLDVDFFIAKIAGAIVKNFDLIFKSQSPSVLKNSNLSFKIQTENGQFSFLVKLGFQLENANKKDVIFLDYICKQKDIFRNDTSIKDFVNKNPIFYVNITTKNDDKQKQNLTKLYRLSNTSQVNFPFLNAEQLKIVATENQNIIVQGVAGSGKTNVCIEKLIWTACKNYGGKILYTTFSRGLLNDTKLKIECFKNELSYFLKELKDGNVEFLDNDKKKACENYLGIFFFVNEENIKTKIENMIKFFDNQVDYFLIEDLYNINFAPKVFADEQYFIKNYLKNTKNHQLINRISKLKNLSYEIIYKEIFGLIFGYCDKDNFSKILTKDEYISLRKDNFSKYDCETIFEFAKDYQKYMEKENRIDNNFASRIMLENIQNLAKYSLIIADEVQDFSQVNLVLFKNLCLKLFCTGDALQMINPTYFSFAYLKSLLFEKDLSSVSELRNNYRNSAKIQNIINALEEINIKKFGTHNFITSGKGVDSSTNTTTIYCNDPKFLTDVAKNKYDNFTIVVPTNDQKQILRQILKNQEILTIAEIKGLERDVVLLCNILSDNYQSWQMLDQMSLNKKQADENSVFRYYFNMFYVGLSRAKQYLFIFETKNILTFTQFFKNYFECKSSQNTIETLSKIVSKIEYTQDEYLSRIDDFLKLEQFDNALFTAQKLTDKILQTTTIKKIEIFRDFVHFGKHREAGIKFWELGLTSEAKKQFILSKDSILIDLIDAVDKSDQSNLNYHILNYFLDVKDNEIAKKFILDTINYDLQNTKSVQKELSEKLKKLRINKNGK